MFQTYPMESFILPEKFEAMLGIRKIYTKQNTSPNFVSRIPFKDQYVSRAILGIETVRYDNISCIFRRVFLSCSITNHISGTMMLLKWLPAYQVALRIQQNNII